MDIEISDKERNIEELEKEMDEIKKENEVLKKEKNDNLKTSMMNSTHIEELENKLTQSINARNDINEQLRAIVEEKEKLGKENETLKKENLMLKNK